MPSTNYMKKTALDFIGSRYIDGKLTLAGGPILRQHDETESVGAKCRRLAE